jgi:hypothetical protein
MELLFICILVALEIGMLLIILRLEIYNSVSNSNSKLSSRLLDEKVQEKYQELSNALLSHNQTEIRNADLIYDKDKGYQIVFVNNKKEKLLFSDRWLSAEEMTYFIGGFIKGLKFKK